MEFTEVKGIPNEVKGSRGRGHQGRLRRDLDEFMSLNIKYAEIIPTYGEYASSRSLSTVIRRVVKIRNMPIIVTVRGDDVYLTRTDL